MRHEQDTLVARVSKGAAAALVAATLGCWAMAAVAQSSDPLPSWNDGPAKQAIVEFVEAVTTEGGADFVPPEDRIATFDQDGTLWVEHPIYRQAMFALERVVALAPEHPEWKRPSRSRRCSPATGRRWPSSPTGPGGDRRRDPCGNDRRGLRGDRQGVAREGEGSAFQPALHRDGLSADGGGAEPLRANGFRTYIVTGGGQEFVRATAKRCTAWAGRR